MVNLRFFATGFFSSLFFGGLIEASSIPENPEEKSILKTACIYHFCENPDEEIEDFFSVGTTREGQLSEKLKK